MTPEDESEAVAKKAELEQRTHIDDVKWLVSSPRGRRLVWWLLGITGVHRTSFNNSGSVMAFQEGQRNIGLTLQGSVVDHAPERYFEMLNENWTKK